MPDIRNPWQQDRFIAEWEPDYDAPNDPDPIPDQPPEVQPDFTAAITLAAEETPQSTETVPTVTGLRLHIDGDFLAYNAAGNDDTLSGQARTNALDKIEALRARVGADVVIVHNTTQNSDKGERYLVAKVKPYQGNRSSGRKPKNQPYLQDYLFNYDGAAFTAKNWSTREADDGMCASSIYGLTLPHGMDAIATKDKDMRMFPGIHINWQSLDITTVPAGAYDVIGADGLQYGLKFFWLQMLMGDTADNCPGLEFYLNPKGKLVRIGEKTAIKQLEGTTTSDEAAAIVIDLYKGCYQDNWADRFVEQAALMWMRTGVAEAPVNDFATHEGVSRINTAFPQEIFDAADALVERVTDDRAALNALAS